MPQFITPAPGSLTQPFKAGSHEGVDIGAPDHSTVVSAQAGRVTFEGIWGAGGNTIIITGSDGWKTYYCHLAKFIVNMGATVQQGDPIAQSGGALGEQGAGNATGPHLHFEIHNSQGQAVDPQQYISIAGAPLNYLPLKTGGGSSTQNSPSIISKLIPYVTFGVLGSPSVRNEVPGATGAATTIDTLTGGAKGLTGVENFLTNPNAWKRVGLFAAGVGLLSIVLIKTLAGSDAVKSVAGVAAKAA
jgi:hypothetical protein